MSVAEAQARVSSAEFAEWMAYDRIEPFGEERADLRAGIVASTVANVGNSAKRDFKPSDFMPRFVKETQTVEDMQNRLMAVSKMASRRKTTTERPPKRTK